jgi:hypothetical protein
MSGDGTTGLDVKVNNESRVTMNSSELSIKNADGDIAKVDFSTTSAANLVFCKPTAFDSQASFNGGNVTLEANETAEWVLGTVEGEGGVVTSGLVQGPARFIVQRPTEFGSTVIVRSTVNAYSIHIKENSGTGYYARNIAYGTSSEPPSGDIHEGDLYIYYTS